MPAPTYNHIRLSPERELDRILPLEQAAEVSSLSADTLKRRHLDKLIRLSPRRLGMRLRDALMLSETAEDRSPPWRAAARRRISEIEIEWAGMERLVALSVALSATGRIAKPRS